MVRSCSVVNIILSQSYLLQNWSYIFSFTLIFILTNHLDVPLNSCMVFVWCLFVPLLLSIATVLLWLFLYYGHSLNTGFAYFAVPQFLSYLLLSLSSLHSFVCRNLPFCSCAFLVCLFYCDCFCALPDPILLLSLSFIVFFCLHELEINVADWLINWLIDWQRVYFA